MTLQEGLSRVKSLIDATAANAMPGLEAVPAETNSDVRLAGQLRNNHSLYDHTDPERYPNFEDCDSLKDLIDDGWQASYGLTVKLRSQRDADAVLRAVREYWEKSGYEVRSNFYNRESNEQYDLWVDAGYATYRFYIDRATGEIYLNGFTRCLPP